MTSGKAIVNILKEQINSYKILLMLLEEERLCLIDINADKIEQISKEKDTVVMRLRLLEEERIKLMNEFAEDNGLSKNMNLEDLTKHTKDNTFSVLRMEMLSILRNIEEKNKFNTFLINRSIGYLNTTTSFFNSFATQQIQQTTGVLLSKET